MTARKLSLIVATTAVFILMTAGVASATNGPNCSLPANQAQFRAGKLIGKNIVRQAWNGIGQDVNRFDEFEDTVRDIIHTAITGLPNTASDKIKCRAKGMGQGVCDELNTIQTEVGSLCLLDGQTWGDLSGELYCALSIAFDGLDVAGLLPNPPDGLCGQNFESGCHDQFASYAEATPLPPAVNECKPYTTGSFTAVYAESLANMCVFEIP